MNLLLDSNDLLNMIKKAATDAVNAGKPTSTVYGKVTSASPLKISIEQKMTLTKEQLVLTRNVTDYETNITMDWVSEETIHDHSYTDDGSSNTTGDNTHSHKIKGKKKITVHNSLVVGDEVILIQIQGGQKFIVWDRIGKS